MILLLAASRQRTYSIIGPVLAKEHLLSTQHFKAASYIKQQLKSTREGSYALLFAPSQDTRHGQNTSLWNSPSHASQMA